MTPAPDGTGSIIQYNGNTYTIGGGTQAGANLFHSFQQFGLQPSEIADFLSNPAIQNVVGRVVGGDPSIIEGLIRLSGGNSNLFLMNPAGWVFTNGASLDVPGSFGVTTANRIGFGDAFFNAVGGNDYATLIGNPSSLIFDSAQPGAIINTADLSVNSGSLWMVGGSVINTGAIAAPNGTITLAAVPGQSQVALKHEGMVLSFLFDALAVDEVQPNTPLGIRAADLPSYLNGSHSLGMANEVVRTENGELWLVGSQMQVVDGEVAIANRVTAENVNLIAANQVKVTDPALVEGDTTVVRLPEAGGTNTLSVIDSRADNPYDLLYGGAAGTIAKIIDRDENGIEVITAELADIAAEGGQVDAVSITAEGNEGNFWLGNTWITDETVNDQAQQLAMWSASLSEGADLLLYSCFTALGATGEALVSSLANLTGMDVAASTNATGSANYGGDWTLEASTGSIEAGNPFEAETLSGWDGKLATLTVSNLNNTGAGSLRQRIQVDAAAGDMITFGVSGTITLAGTGSGTNGEILWATNNLTLDGGSKIVVDGGGNSRVFNISATNATIENITIQNGSVNAVNTGGGLFVRNNITLTNSTVSGNSAGYSGGLFVRNGNITLTNSTVSGNSAGSGGGLVALYGNITLTNSTVSGNSARNDVGGGLLAAYGKITLTNSTVSGNSAGNVGGGLFARHNNITLTNSTVSGNSAGNVGGGLFAENGNITLTNSIVANNTDNGTAPDLRAGGTITATNSLIEDSTGATITGSNNIIGVDPKLGPLANNGGPTQTHALLAGSPAIDAGNNGLVPSIRNSGDQRGFIPGIFNGKVDIGAYEFGAVDPNPPVAAAAATAFNADLFDSQEETENLTDEFLRSNSCQTIPEIELEKDDEEDGEQIEEDLNATDGIDLDEDCLPMNDNDGDGAQFLPFSSF
nr:DUF4347 domain-containing protein [Spirulina major]